MQKPSVFQMKNDYAENNIKIFIARRLIEWAMAVLDAFARSTRLVGGTQVPPGSPESA